MLKKLLVLAVVATVASISSTSSANADWWWSSRPSRSSQTELLMFPQRNQMIVRQNYGSGISIYSSSPITQYGADAPLYVPMQRPFNRPAWAR